MDNRRVLRVVDADTRLVQEIVGAGSTVQWRQVEAAVLESAGPSAHAWKRLADLRHVFLVG